MAVFPGKRPGVVDKSVLTGDVRERLETLVENSQLVVKQIKSE